MARQPMSTHARLSMPRRVGFGFGDFGFNIYYTGLNLFLLYYYTDVLGIRPALGGLIFAIPLVWDAVTDPVMGVIASRTQTRFGSYRPYILFGAVPLAISFVAMFAAPLIFPGAVLASAIITHLLFRTCYTIVSIPYSALSAKMTQDSGERGALAGVRMIFATLGGLFTVFMTLPLAAHLGGGDMKLGFLFVSIVYSILATGIFYTTFASTVEQVGLGKPRHVSWSELVHLLSRNRALLILISAVVIGAVGGNIFSKALVYYVKYASGLDLSVTTALVILTASVSVGVPIWMAVSRYLPKKTVWMAGAGIAITSQCILFLFSIPSVYGFLTVIAMLGIGNAAFYVTFWSMLPDTVEYGEFRSGLRDEGLVFGLNQLALKAATGIGIGILGFLLELIGYTANQDQSQTAIDGIRTISILIPILCGILSVTLISLYPISKPLHARLVTAINWRNRRRDQT